MIVGYARLSRDEDKENYDSIETQIDIINDCSMKMFQRKADQIYIDDNISGYTFDRPEFNKIKQGIEEQTIDVVIAKDLSRIGRHNAKVLLFIEDSQNAGIRILLPMEGGGYDSLDEDDDVTLGIHTWYNERYIKDISKKIRSSVKKKQEKGRFLTKDVFGYKRSEKDKHQYEIDENSAWIVKLIYEKYISGMGSFKIASYLSDNKIMTPSQAIQKQYEQRSEIYKGKVVDVWYSSLVQRVLKNDIYIGILRTNKTKKIGIKGKSIRNQSKDHFVFYNDHPAIITEDDFNLVQKIIQERNISKSKIGIKNKYLFTSMIFCADCNKPVIGHTSQHGTKSYICSTFHNRGKSVCSSHTIKEKTIVDDIKIHLQDVVNEYEEYLSKIKMDKEAIDYKKLITKCEKDLSKEQGLLKNIIIQKTKDIIKQKSQEDKDIIEQSYNEIEEEKKKIINSLQKRIKELKEINNSEIADKLQSAIDKYKDIINTDNVNRKQIELAVTSIYVDKNKDIVIDLNDDIYKMTTIAQEIENKVV